MKQNPPAGVIHKLYLALGTAVAVFNLTDQLILGQNPLERWVFTIPYLIIGVVLFLYRRSTTIEAIVYMVLAVYVTIFTYHPADFSSTIFFAISLSLLNVKGNWIYLCALLVFSLPFKALYTGGNVLHALRMLAVYLGTGAIYYLRVYTPNKPGKIPELTEQENRLLELLSNGKIQKEAAAEIGESVSQTNEILKRIRKKLCVNTVYEAIAIYARSINRL